MREKRLKEIMSYINSLGVVSMEELCEHFHISISTVRRDIDKLLKQKMIRKIYGGVEALNPGVIPFKARDNVNVPAKDAIAKKASTLIESNELIFIDAGTTTRDIIHYLPDLNKLTILTNSLDVINQAAKFPNISLTIIGNVYKPSSRSFVGTDALILLDKYNISKAFMAATAVSIAHGLTNSDEQEYLIKKKVVEKSHNIYLLADSSKFDHSTQLTYAKLSDIDGIITSSLLTEKYTAYCRDHNIEIHIANQDNA